MAEEVMLTTEDNPFNPFTQFDEWQGFDELQGHHTCAYLARIAVVSESLSPAELDTAINNAIDEIIRINGPGVYKKVTRDDFV